MSLWDLKQESIEILKKFGIHLNFVPMGFETITYSAVMWGISHDLNFVPMGFETLTYATNRPFYGLFELCPYGI